MGCDNQGWAAAVASKLGAWIGLADATHSLRACAPGSKPHACHSLYAVRAGVGRWGREPTCGVGALSTDLRVGMLIRMQKSTSVRVTIETRDAVRKLADDDGLSMDQLIRGLVRAERHRRIGLALAATPLNDVERGWLDGAARSFAERAGR